MLLADYSRPVNSGVGRLLCSQTRRRLKMRIDRFVKVMLVLIVVLLALNCAKDLNLSSDSHGNSNIPARSSSTPTFERTVEAAPTQYKVISLNVNKSDNPGVVQQVLNQQSAEGWAYVGEASGVLIFKK
jgi:preprotein translocase subunit SecF